MGDNNEEPEMAITVSGMFPEGKTRMPAEVVVNRMGSSIVLDLRLTVNDIIEVQQNTTEIAQES